MKKLLIPLALIAAIALLIGLNIAYKPEPVVRENIADALRIYPLMYPEEITDLSQITPDTPTDFYRLELGKPRICARMTGSRSGKNLCIRFEYRDGLVEVASLDKTCQLSVDKNGNSYTNHNYDSRIFDFKHMLTNGRYLSVRPLGAHSGYLVTNYGDNTPREEGQGWLGREYLLDIKCFDFADEFTPVITAVLKLVQLQENEYHGSFYYSIELISYEYGDMHEFE